MLSAIMLKMAFPAWMDNLAWIDVQAKRQPESQQGHRVLDAASVPCKVVGGLGNVKPLQFLIYLSCINKYNIYIYIAISKYAQ